MANQNAAGIKWQLLVMVLSMLVLSCFVSYWLLSQYLGEKEDLRKELQAELAHIQSEITDSLLFGRYVWPSLSIEKTQSTPAAGQFRQNRAMTFYKSGEVKNLLDSLKLLLVGRQPAVESAVVLVEPGKGVKPADVGNITRLVNSAVRNLLKDSAGAVALELLPGDVALIQKAFAGVLAQKDRLLRSNWSDPGSFPRTTDSNLQLVYYVNGRQEIAAITGYKPYLVKKIIPQSFFAALLLVLFLAAFILAYRNLRRQLQLAEIKNGLISNMSHELKTPVSIVKVALEAIYDYDIINNPSQAREYIQMAKLETNRLEMLINKTLNTSLLEQGRITLQREPTDIVVLIRGIVESLKLRLQQDEACINLHTEGADFNLKIDKLHVQGAILNILDNSMKYGGRAVKIDVHVIAGDATLTTYISDTGPGIPEEYREQVFEKFFRIPTGNRHNVQGSGLGLYYVKQVMQLHEGMTTVNNMPGSGCRFTLQFFKNR